MATRTRVKQEPNAGGTVALEEVRALSRDLKAGRLDRRAQASSGSGRELIDEVRLFAVGHHQLLVDDHLHKARLIGQLLEL